jgi:uncharacterized protein (TIGR02246 family)
VGDDERAIVQLLETWRSATAAGDVAKVLGLMSEDAVFLAPGQAPMRGRQAFGEALTAMLPRVRIDSVGEVEEIVVAGDFAYCRTRLSVVVTPRQGGSPVRRSGYALTILRRRAGAGWLVTQDANLLAPEQGRTG